MKVAAHNLGKSEIDLGADTLIKAAKDTGVAFISANARPIDGRIIATGSTIATVGGRRVAVIGVASPRYATPSIAVEDPRSAIVREIQSI
jgi:2',3'-cyclic-nucleotide 2'-phosphodiesterase (5'-nucleotidase family)